LPTAQPIINIGGTGRSARADNFVAGRAGFNPAHRDEGADEGIEAVLGKF
jgi:hypothetical protein